MQVQETKGGLQAQCVGYSVLGMARLFMGQAAFWGWDQGLGGMKSAAYL